MQQLFPSGSGGDDQCDAKTAENCFAVPVALKSTVGAQLAHALKAAKPSSSKTGKKRSRVTEDASTTASLANSERVACADVSLVKRIIEYGACYISASKSFRRRLTALGRLHQQTSTDNAVAETKLCQYALQQAMSLVSRVVAADKQGLLLRPAVWPSPEAKPSSIAATTPTTTTMASPAAGNGERHGTHGSNAAARTTVELYCVFQALELEWQDALTFPSDPTTAHAARTDVQARIVACVDALEETVVEMVLARCHARPRRATSSQSAAEEETLTALRALLLQLPECFSAAEWPSRLLSVGLPQAPAGPHGTALSLTAGEEAVTAILLRTLTAVKQADACDLLHLASAPPVATLAAVALDVPMDLDPEHCTFPVLLGRAWNGVLAARGLRRAMLEAHVFFAFQSPHQGGAKRSAESKKGGKTAATTTATPAGHARNALTACHVETEMRALRQLFAMSLEKEYNHFVAHLGTANASAATETVTLATPSTVFTLAHNVLDESEVPVTDVQQRALRVLDRVKAFDTKGWFSVPAFDLVNADFSSLRFYVRGTVFSGKTKRSAFDALRRLLEQMVDKCVSEYGPTHAFSDCISTLRHKLVDAARQEQLI